MGSMCLRASDELFLDEGQGSYTLALHRGGHDGPPEAVAEARGKSSSGPPEGGILQEPYAMQPTILSRGCSKRPGKVGIQTRRWDPATAVPVELHIYDLGTYGFYQHLNKMLRPLGTGVFHCGVEVYNCEWSFSDTTSRRETTGIFRCAPRACAGHTYSESVFMGRTSCSEVEVLAIMDALQQDWNVMEYDLLRRNCCHFANELCWRLGVGAIPVWITNLAGTFASIEDAGAVLVSPCSYASQELMNDKAKETCFLCCSDNTSAWTSEANYTPIELVTTPGRSGW